MTIYAMIEALPVVVGRFTTANMHNNCVQVSAEDTVVMEPIHGVQNVQKERWDLLCCVCKQRCGAKVQCESCYTAYHPLCGRVAGFHLEAADAADGGDPRFATYCARHRKPRPELSGATDVMESHRQLLCLRPGLGHSVSGRSGLYRTHSVPKIKRLPAGPIEL